MLITVQKAESLMQKKNYEKEVDISGHKWTSGEGEKSYLVAGRT